MAVRCYKAPPEPEYSGTPYEYEPCMRDYPAYLRDTYLRPRLKLVQATPATFNSGKSSYLWHNGTRITLSEGVSAIAQDAAYSPSHDHAGQHDDNLIVRPAAAHISEELQQLTNLYEDYPNAEIDDYLNEFDETFNMLSQLSKQRQRTPKAKPVEEEKPKPFGGLSLV